MNNEWNVDFFQSMSCVEKRLETEAVFTKTEMNNEWNVHFLPSASYVEKRLETEAVFTKTEMNNESNLYFFTLLFHQFSAIFCAVRLQFVFPRLSWA